MKFALCNLYPNNIFDVVQDFLRTREVGEFLSGALAGAMTKAVLAPLETIRLVCHVMYLFI